MKKVKILISSLVALMGISMAACGEQAKELTGIEVSGSFKTEYEVGETFDKTGMVVTAKHSDNTSAEVTDFTIEPNRALEKTDTKVTVYFENKTKDVSITVKEHTYVASCATSGLSSDFTIPEVAKEEGQLFKFEQYNTLYRGESFYVALTIDGKLTNLGFTNINGVTNKADDEQLTFLTAGEENKIHVDIQGSYTLYVFVKADLSTELWISIWNYVMPEPASIECKTNGLSNDFVLDRVTPDEGKTYKFEGWSWIAAEEEFEIEIKADDKTFIYDYDDIDTVENMKDSKTIDFISEGTNGKLHINHKVSITFYLNLDDKFQGKIWACVWDYEVIEPDPTEKWDELYAVGYGSYLSGSEAWSTETGIHASKINDNPEALEKYTMTSDFALDDVMVFNLKNGAYYFNFNDVKGVFDEKGEVAVIDDYLTVEQEGSSNIKVKRAGNYTISVTVWSNYTADVYYFFNESITPTLEDGCYVIGLWDKQIVLDSSNDKPNPESDIIHAYEPFQFFWKNDILDAKIVSGTKVYNFKFADVKAQNKGESAQTLEGDFLQEGTDGKIQVKYDCDFTLYMFVYSNETIAIYATVWNVY